MTTLAERFSRAVTPPAHRWRWPIFLGCAVVLIAATWWDQQLHFAVRFDAVYFALIALVAWFTGPWSAGLLAGVAVIFGIFPDLMRFPESLSTGMVVWNGTATFVVYFTGVFLLSSLRRSWMEKQLAARTDPLTGLLNRRALHDVLEAELQRSRRYGRPLAFAYLDLDGFKEVNDRYGHEAGDRALRTVGEVLTRELRAADVVARLGGDEFAVLLPETALDGAEVLLERFLEGLRRTMAEEGWPELSASAGIHTPGRGDEEAEDVIRAADDLMYEAKREGKSRIRTSGGGDAPGPGP